MFRPRYISFDCYGTMINFIMGPTAGQIFADRVDPAAMPGFLDAFRIYRLDEVLGAWKPFYDVIDNAIARACERYGVVCDASDVQALYDAIPTWQPHADVPGPLGRVAEHYPLVILSNSMTDLIPHSARNIGVPFHAIYTAEEAGAYKPLLRPFEYMVDQLGCAPEDMMHVSSSPRYDLMSAHDLGFGAKVFVDRGHEAPTDHYGVVRIKDFSELPALVGL
ncbi:MULTISPECIES: haloacid dehalogenase type II [unclassified Sphingobium]|uniref:haloacid dehalogenase type II n=1 Tax=unclassified Sphingobium TaxID=2611147 RepID=UPI000D154606|nr:MULTISPECIES: haloacid dehalogenase type II [unclassified Sphingobium]MBG6119776.1 2-haloacid dehalogenase [Sphingobium sp. JAI105]PSO10602.1 haloacid dehalogenase type II [Sphingobium sp. AEW4]TWD01203.1 2-haloacid dehalogenase [Sphingobium sp. AEW010]TWD19927.1 2-haloacid dehalogenase [Sphingobium sp. AEW013]TWD22543.1 2-haloacid dehalogenase [Sphingobium sp. AEW001]